MQILYICPYFEPAYIYGGPIQCFSTACQGLSESGAQVTVFTTNANGKRRLDVPVNQPISKYGALVWYYPLSVNGLSFFYSRSLAEAIKMRVSEFDIVVNTSLWGYSLIPSASACVNQGIPYVISTHGQLFPWAMEKKQIKKKIYLELIIRKWMDRSAAIHCTDSSEAEIVTKLSFQSPVFIVPNSVNSSQFINFQSKGNLRTLLGITDNALILLLLGRITQIKRPDIAVEVLGAAQSLNREIHLVVAGPDEDGILSLLESQARDLGCQEKLHFTGLLDKEGVITALADADLLLMPSEINENFGLSAVEAMAAGVAILVSDGIPVGHLAVKAGAGLVVPCTKEAFQQATMELLDQPETLKEMGKKGQELVRQYFDVPIVTKQLLRQYEAIIATGKPLPDSEIIIN